MINVFLIIFMIGILEIYLIVLSTALISIWGTIACCIATAFIGSLLFKKEGILALSKIQKSMAELKSPQDELIQGGMILVGGAFLITPGFVTDFVGFMLLVPQTRKLLLKLVKAKIQKFLKNKIRVVNFSTTPDTEEKDAEVIDVK